MVTAEVKRIEDKARCRRCYQYTAEAKDYFLCNRCQIVLHTEHNSLCVSCGCDDAINNLCGSCRAARIAEYDSRIGQKHDA